MCATWRNTVVVKVNRLSVGGFLIFSKFALVADQISRFALPGGRDLLHDLSYHLSRLIVSDDLLGILLLYDKLRNITAIVLLVYLMLPFSMCTFFDMVLRYLLALMFLTSQSIIHSYRNEVSDKVFCSRPLCTTNELHER